MALSAAPVYWAGMLAEAEAEPDGIGAALAGGTAAPVAAPVGGAWIWPSLEETVSNCDGRSDKGATHEIWVTGRPEPVGWTGEAGADGAGAWADG